VTPSSAHVLKYADDAWAWTVRFKDPALDATGLCTTFSAAMGEVERVTRNAAGVEVEEFAGTVEVIDVA